MYSRGGDDEPRTYETARIDVTLLASGKCDICSNKCRIEIKLKYHAHVRGCLASGFLFGAGYGLEYNGNKVKFTATPTPEESRGINNWGTLEGEIAVGSITATGGELTGKVRVQQILEGSGITPRMAEIINFKAKVINDKCDLELELNLEELNTGSGGIGGGEHPHPVIDITNGEEPYPLSECELGA